MDNEKRETSVGKRIQKARKKINFTQEQLGRLLGVPTNTVARWEGEDVFPKGAHKSKVINFLELAEDEKSSIMMNEALAQGGIIGLAGFVGFVGAVMSINPTVAAALPLVGTGVAAMSGLAGISLFKALSKVGTESKTEKNDEE